jgi:hypothetical protein
MDGFTIPEALYARPGALGGLLQLRKLLRKMLADHMEGTIYEILWHLSNKRRLQGGR